MGNKPEGDRRQRFRTDAEPPATPPKVTKKAAPKKQTKAKKKG